MTNKENLNKEEIQFLESLWIDINSNNLKNEIKSLLSKWEISIIKDFDMWGISKSVNWNWWWEFIYVELKKWNEEAKEKIMNCEKIEELEKFFDEMYEKYFLNYNVKIKEFKEKIVRNENFRSLPLEKQKKMFVSMLDLNQMYVNMSERNDKKFGISDEDVKLSEEFYNLR